MTSLHVLCFKTYLSLYYKMLLRLLCDYVLITLERDFGDHSMTEA